MRRKNLMEKFLGKIMLGGQVLHEAVAVMLFARGGGLNAKSSGGLTISGKRFLRPDAVYRLVLDDGRSGQIKIKHGIGFLGEDTVLEFVIIGALIKE